MIGCQREKDREIERERLVQISEPSLQCRAQGKARGIFPSKWCKIPSPWCRFPSHQCRIPSHQCRIPRKSAEFRGKGAEFRGFGQNSEPKPGVFYMGFGTFILIRIRTLVFIHPYSKFWLSILMLKVQRTSMSSKSWFAVLEDYGGS